MNNPLLRQDALPPFGEIRTEHMEPAIAEILGDNRQRIQALAGQATPDWNSLVAPMLAMEQRLSNAWSVISHLNGVVNDPPLRDAFKACLSRITEYSTELGQNQALFDAYQRLAESDAYERLDAAQRKTIDNTLRDFRLGGVGLPEDQKQRFRTLSNELAALSNRFSDNVLDATQHWHRHVTDPEALAGLPESALDSARQAARQRDLDGYLITLDFPSYFPVMNYCDNRDLRREVYEAYVTRASDQGPDAGRWDNTAVMGEILGRRHDLARLLGFGNYAERSLYTKMARSVEEVEQFLERLARDSLPMAQREYQEVRDFAREQHGIEDLQAWDLGYYGEKLRQHRFDISQEMVRPWFPLERVLAGLFECTSRLFGIQVVADPPPATWHPDVRVYRIERGGEPVAWFYLDLFARQGKRGGAWMADCRQRYRRGDGSLQLPVAFLTANFTPPVDDRPALLTHDEVTTLFHEFGHGLHHMLTRIEVPEVAGINGVPWDAVELPSQFLENWCWQPESLALISGHYENGEPLPETLLERMLAARNFHAGLQMVRQLEFALFDIRLHAAFEPGRTDPQSVLEAVRRQVAVVRPPAFNRFANSFSHIFAGGYAAGYYSYKWAEVLAADAFSRFLDKGIFDADTGRAFLTNILEQGGSRDPLELFVAFRGREPRTDALLQQAGIIGEEAPGLLDVDS